MKILILSASIGSGHMQAAEAIAEILNDKAEVLDFMDKNISTLNWLLKRLYLSILGLIPDLYDRIYRLAGVRRFGSVTRLIWSTLMYLPFSRLINRLNPDVIICTHPFPEAAAALWKFLHPKNDKRFTLAAVLTDYSLHEIWIYDGVDIYFVATEDMKRELEAHGQCNVFATGIPIRSNFSTAPINSDSTTLHSVLIMGGGLGLGAFEETIFALEGVDFKLKIIVITGKNDSLQARLKSMNSKHELVVLGFVDNICELMQSSDILISKPGALTLSEAFAVGLPILLLPPIPGPESLNAEYAVKGGAALALQDSTEVTETIEIVNDSERLKTMKMSAKKLAKPFAATDIAHRLVEYTELKDER
ncbi:MAG: glycosyltransferase [Selenomonadaceae bacterium]|nr:glycosyltransferase [Selenomonadaceae bacterium]